MVEKDKYGHRVFKGQVRISDIKESFDEVVSNINTLIDNYNESLNAQDVDYTLGGSSLANAGYTLTVGGFKQFCQACDGYVTGAKPFRISDTQFKMTTGNLITKHGVYTLPDSVLTIPTSTAYRTLYYNISTKAYQWTPEGTVSVVKTVKKHVGSNMYEYIPDSGLYKLNSLNNPHAGGSTVDLEEEDSSTLRFFKLNLDSNNADSIKDGKICINIADYGHIPVSFLHKGSSVICKQLNKNFNLCNFAMGTLKEVDGKYYFTPKLIVAVTEYVPNLYFSVFGGVPASTSYDSDTGVCCVSLPLISTSKWESRNYSKNFSFQFGTSSITNKDEIMVFNNKALVTSLALPQDISKYDINCIFPIAQFMDNAVSDGRTFTEGQDIGEFNWTERDFMYATDENGEYPVNIKGADFEEYVVVEEESDSAAYRVCDINPAADTKMINTIKSALVENVYGTFKITTQTRNPQPFCPNGGAGETIDTSPTPKFVSGMEAVSYEGHGYKSTYLFGKLVARNRQTGHRNLNWWQNVNFLFVPKKVSNPYSHERPSHNCDKWFNVVISKNIKDT